MKAKKKKNSFTPSSPEQTVASQGPTPVCTPTVLEKRKSGAAKMNVDDKENVNSFQIACTWCKRGNTSDSNTYTLKEKKTKKRQSVILSV